MKNIFRKIHGAGALLAILIIAIALTVVAQVTAYRSTPDAWTDNTGTNYYGINGSAVPYIQQGTNVYTGTNQTFFVTNTAGTTRTLTFKNGLLTGYQ